jgi:hypothetical protein
MKYTILITLLVSFNVYSHGDHSIPGAIPVAPHGGVVAEASHKHKESAHTHKHSKGSDGDKAHKHEEKQKEKEIFFESKMRGSKIYLYALELDPIKSMSFITREISEFKNMRVTLLDPRKKKTYAVKAVAAGDHWELSLSGIRGRRFIVNVITLFENEQYKAKVQVEKK